MPLIRAVASHPIVATPGLVLLKVVNRMLGSPESRVPPALAPSAVERIAA